ncbi:transcriptional regulator, LysR family [Desulfosarcina variabilis str. Montpellier]|uniref:LysR substrate-binding domain-containing protein n=1 Tax=Desulfosarcina variabilis TaxID=2300 RepID=UPI003AFB76C6
MLNLNHLRIFYCVAKNLSFTKAAKELCVSQPAVTAQMKLFENWCELKFFKKKGRGIQLTDTGHVLYMRVCKIFEHEKEIEGLLDDFKQLKQGVLRIGTTKTYVRLLMPMLAESFRRKYPMIRICLNEGSSKEVIQSLLDLTNEIAIGTKVLDDPNISFSPFSKEELIPIISPSHPFTSRVSVTVDELAKEPLILNEPGSGTRKYVTELFEREGCPPNILMETANSEFIKEQVIKGSGISFLVREAVQEELAQRKLMTVAIKGKKVYIDACIARLKNEPLSPPAKAFIQMLDELCERSLPINGIRSLLAKRETKVKPIHTDLYGYVHFGI